MWCMTNHTTNEGVSSARDVDCWAWIARVAGLLITGWRGTSSLFVTHDIDSNGYGDCAENIVGGHSFMGGARVRTSHKIKCNSD